MSTGKIFGLGIVAWVVLMAILVGMAAASLMWWQPWVADKRTEITRNTNQYVTTQQELIHDALRRYSSDGVTEAQQLNAVLDMCRAASRIDDEFVPEPAKPIMREHECWRGE